jgi:hypothetical protein
MLAGFWVGALGFGIAAAFIARARKRAGARAMSHREFNTTI